MLKKLTGKIILLSLALGVFAGCAQELDEFSMEEKKEPVNMIVPFIQKQNNTTDLYLLNTLSKKTVRLTDDAFEEADPMLLPNGRILFASRRTGTWQLFTIAQNGTEPEQITNDKAFNNYRPSVTIDGRIIFVSDREVKPKIFSIDYDGGSLVKLTSGDHYYDYPSPLDDGTILYLTNEGNKWQIWMMNADGSNKQKITSMNTNPISLAAMPSYVRDTQLRTPMIDDSFEARRRYQLNQLVPKAVFTTRDENGDLEIYRVNVDGSDLRNLTKMPGVDANPVVLRNGKILFTSDRDGTFDVWMMDPDGYNPLNLTREPYYASSR